MRRGLAEGLAPWLLAAAAAAQALQPLPQPALEAFEPAAREHLKTAREELEAVRSQGASAAELAEAYGRMGKIYFGYELHDLAAAAWRNALELQPADGRWLYLLGLLERIEGDWDEAESLLARAIDADPENLAARIHRGRLLFDRGAVDAAGEEFEAVRARQPTSAAAALGLARVALAQGRYEDAVQWGRRTLALEPGADVAHHQIGLAYRALGDIERAERHLALARHHDVTFPDPLTDDLAEYVRGAAIQAKHGLEAARAGRQALAIRYFERAVEIAPEEPAHRYNLALSLRESGQPERAIAELERLTEDFPEHRDGHFNLAALLARKGDVAGAAEHYRRAFEIDPGDRVARIEWAAAVSHLGQVERAERELAALVESAPDDAEARIALATLLAGESRVAAAREVLTAGLDRDVSAAEWAALADFRGELAAAAGDGAGARRDFEQALERAPGRREARWHLGRLLASEGEYRAAAEQFERLVEVEPANEEYQVSLGLSLRLAGADDEALEALEEATAGLTSSVPLHHLLAQALADSGRPGDGTRALALAREVMSAEPTVEHAETVARALAAVGDYAAAISWQERVVAERSRAGDSVGAEASARRLDAYRAAAGSEPSGGRR